MTRFDLYLRCIRIFKHLFCCICLELIRALALLFIVVIIAVAISTADRTSLNYMNNNVKFDLSHLFDIHVLDEDNTHSMLTLHSLEFLLGRYEVPTVIIGRDHTLVSSYDQVVQKLTHKFCVLYEIITEVSNQNTLIGKIIFDFIKPNETEYTFPLVIYDNAKCNTVLNKFFKTSNNRNLFHMLDIIESKANSAIKKYQANYPIYRMAWEVWKAIEATRYILKEELQILVEKDEIIKLLGVTNVHNMEIKVLMAIM